jgi:hypothetical protein
MISNLLLPFDQQQPTASLCLNTSTMPTTTTSSSSNAAYNNTFDAVTADDPPRAASPGITLAQSNNHGYHGDVNDHHPVKASGQATQPPLIVGSRCRIVTGCYIFD